MNSAIVSVHGYVGGDPILKEVGDGTVAEFSVGMSYRRRIGNQDVEFTDWYRCSLWSNPTAAAERLHRGAFVNIMGHLRHRKYTHDGRDRVENEIHRVTHWNLLVPKDDGSSAAEGTSEGTAQNTAQGSTPEGTNEGTVQDAAAPAAEGTSEGTVPNGAAPAQPAAPATETARQPTF